MCFTKSKQISYFIKTKRPNLTLIDFQGLLPPLEAIRPNGNIRRKIERDRERERERERSLLDHPFLRKARKI